jgi:thioredoxin-related protein
MPLKTILISLFCLFLTRVSISQETIHFTNQSFDKILHRSKSLNKPVMIYLTGTGCSLCVKMEKRVFTQPAVYELYNREFINMESFDDAQKPDSATKALREKYHVISNPTFLFIDSEGNIIHKSGYKTTDDFVLTGKQAAGTDNYRSWKKEFDNGDYKPATVAKFLAAELKPSLFSDENFQCLSQEVLDHYFASIGEKEYAASFNWNIINLYVANPYSPVFNYLVNNQAVFSSQYGQEAVNKKIYDVYDHVWVGLTTSATFKNAETLIRSSEVPMAKLLIRMRNMYKAGAEIRDDKNKDWTAFINEYDTLIRRYAYLINVHQPYRWSENICEKRPANQAALMVANKWMQAILTYPENEDYDYYNTYAKTFFLLGNKKDAVINQQKAIDIAVKTNEDKDEIDGLKKTLKTYRQ